MSRVTISALAKLSSGPEEVFIWTFCCTRWSYCIPEVDIRTMLLLLRNGKLWEDKAEIDQVGREPRLFRIEVLGCAITTQPPKVVQIILKHIFSDFHT